VSSRTFSSLDDKLQLRDWSLWPERWLQCAKRFIFDYKGFVEEYKLENEEAENDDPADILPIVRQKTPDKNTRSVMKKNEGEYDPSVHFGSQL
jgi:hypothetical protein